MTEWTFEEKLIRTLMYMNYVFICRPTIFRKSLNAMFLGSYLKMTINNATNMLIKSGMDDYIII